jgi:hypothetical protein
VNQNDSTGFSTAIKIICRIHNTPLETEPYYGQYSVTNTDIYYLLLSGSTCMILSAALYLAGDRREFQNGSKHAEKMAALGHFYH